MKYVFGLSAAALAVPFLLHVDISGKGEPWGRLPCGHWRTRPFRVRLCSRCQVDGNYTQS